MRPSEKFEAKAHAPKMTGGVVDATLRTFLADNAFHRALQPAAID